jgi:hypothetical protein
MSRYLILITRILAVLLILLTTYTAVTAEPSPIVLDILKCVWTALMVSLVCLLLRLSVDDFRKQD